MSKILLSTEFSYEGYSENEESWVIGTYAELSEMEDVKENSIEWNSNNWYDEVSYFTEYLEFEIDRKSKETGSELVLVALAGSVGVWKGKFTGGKFIENVNKILEMDVDDIEVKCGGIGEPIEVCGYHHDGTHYFNIYLVTLKEIEQLGLKEDYEENNLDELKTLTRFVKELEPLKLRSDQDYFNI